jgi:hypothetical protein
VHKFGQEQEETLKKSLKELVNTKVKEFDYSEYKELSRYNKTLLHSISQELRRKLSNYFQREKELIKQYEHIQELRQHVLDTNKHKKILSRKYTEFTHTYDAVMKEFLKIRAIQTILIFVEAFIKARRERIPWAQSLLKTDKQENLTLITSMLNGIILRLLRKKISLRDKKIIVCTINAILKRLEQ